MKKWKILTLCIACIAAFSLSIPDDADARRLGGGRSFGSSPSMSRPAAPSAPSGTFRQQQGNTFQRQQTNPSTGAGAAAMARPGWGGMLGGLLAGTFIGSMLFGNGMGGAGAGGGLLDLILIGLVVYFGIKLFRRFKANQQGGAEASAYRRAEPRSESPSGASAWDRLTDAASGQSYDQPQASAVPADFDQEEFLRGAKMAYARLQESWDRRDLDDIAQFATAPVLQELRAQYAEDPEPGVTQLLKVDASVVEVREEGDEQRVAVLFDVLMREEPEQARPEQVRELWHFVRNRRGDDAWRLDGIQQMA